MSGFTTVSAAALQNAAGTLVTNATISFAPVDSNGQALSFRTGGTAVGQTIASPVSTLVTNGAFSVQLADTSLTNPQNVRYAISLTDNVSGNSLLGEGYGAFQPSGATYSFDTQFVPNATPQTLIQVGATGPQGPPGDVSLAELNAAIAPLANYSTTTAVTSTTSGSTTYTPTSISTTFPLTFFSGTATTVDGQCGSISIVMSATQAAGVTIPVVFASKSGSAMTYIAVLLLVTKGSGLNTWAAGTDFTAFDVPVGTYYGYGIASSANAIPYYTSTATGVYGVAGALATSSSVGSSVTVTSYTGAMNMSVTTTVTSTVASSLVPTLAQLQSSATASVTALQTSTTLGLMPLSTNYPPATTTSKTQTVGVTNYSTSLTAGRLSFTYILPQATALTVAGTVSSVSVNVGSAPVGTTVPICLVTQSGSTFTVLTVFNCVTTATGVNTWTTANGVPANLAAPVGCLFGFSIPSGSYAIQYAGSGGAGYQSINGVPAAGNTYALYSSGAGIGVNLSVNVAQPVYNFTPVPSLSQIQSPPNINANKTTLFSNKFAALPTGAVTVGNAWTVGSGLVSPSTGQGFGQYISMPQIYAVEKRTYRCQVEILTSGAVIGVGAVLAPNGRNSAFGSLVTLDSGANTLNIYDNYSGSATAPAVAQSVALGFTMVVGQKYMLQISVNQRAVTALVTDPITATQATVTSGNNSTDTGTYPTAGTMMDCLAFVNIAGQFRVDSASVLANVAHPRLYIVGDSITYGFTVSIAQSWAHMLATACGASAIVAGRPSEVSAETLTKFTNETPFLLPDTALILIGTNDVTVGTPLATYEATMTSIVAAAYATSKRVVIGLLPQVVSTYGSQSLLNSYNTFLLTLPVDALLRFDLAMSLNNDGVTQNTALYSDGVHPNPSGCIAMYNRVAVDAPWLLD